MWVRGIFNRDVQQIQEIWQKYFANDFPFEEFFNQMKFSCLVEDSSNKIVTAMAVRPILEAVMITNKDCSPRKRVEAILQLRPHIARLGQVHAFVTDDGWESHLKRHGFRDSKGKALVIG